MDSNGWHNFYKKKKVKEEEDLLIDNLLNNIYIKKFSYTIPGNISYKLNFIYSYCYIHYIYV